MNIITTKGERDMNHATIWAAIDRVAIRLRMTRSGLARHCGMDATAFNKQKIRQIWQATLAVLYNGIQSNVICASFPRRIWSHNQRSRTRLGPTERRRHRCVTGLLVTRNSLLVFHPSPRFWVISPTPRRAGRDTPRPHNRGGGH